MGRHFEWSVSGDGGFSYSRREDRIAAEAALDGLYVVRTSLPEAELDGPGTVRACRRLSRVERAFRSLKTVNMKVRPVYRCAEDRVRAHVLICMLAQCVEFEMRRRLAPVLFDDGDWEGAEAGRASVVAPAEVSESAKSRASSKLTADGLPAQGFRSLLGCLSGIVRNTVTPNIPDAEPFPTVTEANAIQRRAPDPLGVRLRCSRQGFPEIQLYEVRSEGYGSTHSEVQARGWLLPTPNPVLRPVGCTVCAGRQTHCPALNHDRTERSGLGEHPERPPIKKKRQRDFLLAKRLRLTDASNRQHFPETSTHFFVETSSRNALW